MMGKLKLFVELIIVAIWPATIMIVVFYFRKQIRTLLANIKGLELGGLKLMFDASRKGLLLNETVKEITKAYKDVIDNKKTTDEVEVELTDLLTERFNELIQKDIVEIVEKKEQPKQKSEVVNPIVEITSTDPKDKVLLAFAAGETYDLNIKYRIYFDPTDRNHNTSFKYLGLYRYMKVEAIGTVQKIISCDYENGELIGDDLQKATPEERQRIKSMIEEARDELEYKGITHGHKFFLVDTFAQMEPGYIKTTPYAIRTKKYIWLDQIEGFRVGMGSYELANLLNGKEWE